MLSLAVFSCQNTKKLLANKPPLKINFKNVGRDRKNPNYCERFRERGKKSAWKLLKNSIMFYHFRLLFPLFFIIFFAFWQQKTSSIGPPVCRCAWACWTTFTPTGSSGTTSPATTRSRPSASRDHKSINPTSTTTPVTSTASLLARL